MSEYLRTTTCVLLDVDGMQAFNDEHGRAIGDNLLMNIMALLEDQFPEPCNIIRLQGDEFFVTIEDKEPEFLAKYAQIASKQIQKRFSVCITFGIGSGYSLLEAKNSAIKDLFNRRMS